MSRAETRTRRSSSRRYGEIGRVRSSRCTERHPRPTVAERILERMVEPERIIQFRVPWMEDSGEVQVNRGYRVEFSSTFWDRTRADCDSIRALIGSILQVPGFRADLQDALTTLPIGGGKGGSDFIDAEGRSDCGGDAFLQTFMTELFRHVGPNTDVPAGDIGVGSREIGYLVRPVQAAGERDSAVC